MRKESLNTGEVEKQFRKLLRCNPIPIADIEQIPPDKGGVYCFYWPGPRDFTSLLSVPHRIFIVNENIFYARRRFSVTRELGDYALRQAGVQLFGERGRPICCGATDASPGVSPAVGRVRVQRGISRRCPFRYLRGERAGVESKDDGVKVSVNRRKEGRRIQWLQK